MKFLKKIFSVKNKGKHKVWNILGIKFSFKKRDIIKKFIHKFCFNSKTFKYDLAYLEECDKNIQIFCTYHYDEAVRILQKKGWYIPISTGSSLVNNFKNILQDNIGINISEKNNTFADLTAQYWIWKNVNAEYVGLENHNKHLLFEPSKIKYTAFRRISEYLYNYYFFKYSKNKIYNKICSYDIVLPYKLTFKGASLYEQYSDFHDASKYVEFESILLKNNPEYKDYILQQRNLKEYYLCNVRIMKKNLFDAFCEFIFPSLFEYEETYKYNEGKYPAWFNERFFNAWLNYQIDNNHLKILEIDSCSIKF